MDYFIKINLFSSFTVATRPFIQHMLVSVVCYISIGYQDSRENSARIFSGQWPHIVREWHLKIYHCFFQN